MKQKTKNLNPLNDTLDRSSYRIDGLPAYILWWICMGVMLLATPLYGQRAEHPVIFPTAIYSNLVGYVGVAITPESPEYHPYPIATLGESQQIDIHFDLLDDVPHQIYYRIDHCNALWGNSGLSVGDYLSGTAEGVLSFSVPSRATQVSYRHYCISLGQEQTLLLSGNYLLTAYLDAPSDNVLFRAAFAVEEEQIETSAQVSASTSATIYDQHQQVSVALRFDTPQSQPENYYRVIVAQNSSQQRTVLLTKPNKLSPLQMAYTGLYGALFAAGNHFHATEILTDKYNGMGVNRSYSEEGIRHQELFVDLARVGADYVNDFSTYGRYVMRNVDAPPEEKHYTTDYYAVHFTLETKSHTPPLPAVLLEGEAFEPLSTDYRQMVYNEEEDCWQQTVLLKGGYIGYRYMSPLASQHSSQPSLSSSQALLNAVDGDHYQTSNYYTILVYRRLPSDRYDHLVGVRYITSNSQ